MHPHLHDFNFRWYQSEVLESNLGLNDCYKALALRLVSTKSHNKFNKDIICIISSIIIIIIFNEKLDSIIMVITHTMPCRLLVFVKQQGT